MRSEVVYAPTGDALARLAGAVSIETLPDETIEAATVMILDTLAVIAAGAQRPEVMRLQALVPRTRRARIIGASSRRTDSDWAAFANAAAGSFLELDQGERPTGHPALHVLPAALAHAEACHASGADLLVAFVSGYEIQSRIEHAFALRWPVHPHGTFGTPAAAAALAKLDGAGVDEIAASINAGASLAGATSWTACLEGATVRNAFAGLSARTAFLARTSVAAGFTASGDAVSDTFGRVLGKAQDGGVLRGEIGEPRAIHNGYFKFHAACALAHPALDAVLDAVGIIRRPGAYPPVVARRTFTARDIAKVVVRTTERASRLADPYASNELGAKFSIPVAVATALINGNTGPDSFAPEQVERPETGELASLIKLEPDSAMTASWPREFRAEATVLLRDGTVLTGSCKNPYGSRENPAATQDLRAKFEYLVGGALSAKVASSAWDRGLKLVESADVHDWLDDVLAQRHRTGSGRSNESASASRRVTRAPR
jgi:2-methylcitrate dehydratase PrpD